MIRHTLTETRSLSSIPIIAQFVQSAHSKLFSQNVVDSDAAADIKRSDVLGSLVTDVGEPWIKHFLTSTLEMAVNGDKRILTSQQDGGEEGLRCSHLFCTFELKNGSREEVILPSFKNITYPFRHCFKIIAYIT